MKKTMTKLIASVLSLIVAAALAVVASFAWLTISAEPEVGGIEIRVSGDTTILMAADIVVQNSDGTVSHYPGNFSRTLSFSDYDTYDYITDLAPLTPVSTTDGVHWVLADYYTASDLAVQQGMAVVGQLKKNSELPVDTSLHSANLTESQAEERTGSYVYVDFWVVSPGDDYELRVSTGDTQSNSGSFLISSMDAVRDGEGYALTAGDDSAAASARVGFLVNYDWSPYRDTRLYLGSDAYDDSYTHLRGAYQEPGQSLDSFSAAQNTFTIYEPNGDLHPDGSTGYKITKPLGLYDEGIYPSDISQRLTVQLTNHWKPAQQGQQTMLEQEFTAATIGHSDLSSPEAALDYFYNQRLQGMFTPYVDRGLFVNSTQALYADADANGLVAQDSIALRTADTATDEVVITTLQKNIPQRIRMFIWLEGQDADCVNHEAASGFILSLELAGS